jgi:hypothetical protein
MQMPSLKKFFERDSAFIWAGSILICLVVAANEPKTGAVLFGCFLIVFGIVKLIVKRCDENR